MACNMAIWHVIWHVNIAKYEIKYVTYEIRRVSPLCW